MSAAMAAHKRPIASRDSGLTASASVHKPADVVVGIHHALDRGYEVVGVCRERSVEKLNAAGRRCWFFSQFCGIVPTSAALCGPRRKVRISAYAVVRRLPYGSD